MTLTDKKIAHATRMSNDAKQMVSKKAELLYDNNHFSR